MNRVVVHERAIAVPCAPTREGSVLNKKCVAVTPRIQWSKKFQYYLRKFIERCFEVDCSARRYRDRSLPLFETRLVNGDCVFAGC